MPYSAAVDKIRRKFSKVDSWKVESWKRGVVEVLGDTTPCFVILENYVTLFCNISSLKYVELLRSKLQNSSIIRGVGRGNVLNLMKSEVK